MKNGPGYLDVAVSSHLDMLKVRVPPKHGGGGAQGYLDVVAVACLR
jgi:hypothetical protein